MKEMCKIIPQNFQSEVLNIIMICDIIKYNVFTNNINVLACSTRKTMTLPPRGF